MTPDAPPPAGAAAPSPPPADGDEQELDLTNAHLHSLDGVPLPPSLRAADLTANRLRALDGRLLALPALERLCMRQNLLADAEALKHAAFAGTLRHLDLRDNQLRAPPPLAAFSCLTSLDLSYNELRSTEALAALPHPHLLQELYLQNNKIAALEGLAALSALRVLELGRNRLREVAGLEGLASLRELWLGGNRIGPAPGPGLEPVGATLRRLSLQSNRLESLDGVAACAPALEELYVSHNNVASLAPVAALARLRILDAASNPALTALEPGTLAPLERLTDLWLNDCGLASLDAVEAALRARAPSLACLYLRGCPAAGAPGYRLRCAAAAPRLAVLDDVDVVR